MSLISEYMHKLNMAVRLQRDDHGFSLGFEGLSEQNGKKQLITGSCTTELLKQVEHGVLSCKETCRVSP
jgi:hypothetical protein